MSNLEDRTIPRRAFIRGAAGLIGASAIGLPKLALANWGAPVSAQLSCAHWNGVTFVPAESLSAGDKTLDTVVVKLSAGGPEGNISSIDTSTFIASKVGATEAVFHAWTAPPYGGSTARFVQPVQKGALRLIATVNGAETPVAFTVGPGTGPKLIEGAYVLVAGALDWSQYALVAGKLVDRVSNEAVNFQHVRIDIERT